MKKLLTFLLIVFCALVFVGCKDDVKPSIKIDCDKEITLKVGEEFKVKATLENSDDKDLKLVFESSNKEVVSISQEGVLKALKIGNAVVTVSTNKEDVKTEINVKVIEAVLPTSIELKGKNEVGVGQTITLEATVLPKDAANKDLEWSSSDESILKVANGVVTGIKVGEAKVIAKSKANNDVKAEMTIKVIESINPTSIEIKGESEVEVGQTITLEATVLPENATNKDLQWTSSDETIATVDNNGVVTAVKEGTVTIKVVSKANKDVTNEIKINVVAASGDKLEKIVIRGGKNYLPKGAYLVLELAFVPENFENKNVKWESSNEKVATVVEGVVNAVELGTCKITCTSLADESVKASIEFEVIDESLVVEDFEVQYDADVFYDYDLYKFTVKAIAQATATSVPKTQYSYTTSDETIAKFNKNVLETLKIGHVTITIVEEISGIVKEFDIEVVESPTLESISIEGRNITTDENVTLTIKATPEHANYDVEWVALTPEIAEINEKGYVVPKVAGEAKFKATDKTTGLSCEYTLTINKAFDPSAGPESLEIDTGGIKSIFVGYEMRLSVIVFPTGVSSAVEWQLHDKSKGIAELTQDGVLKGLSEGTARIRVQSTVNGKKSAYIAIEIKKKPEPKPIPNLNGYKIVLMNAESALYEIDPFYNENGLEYTGADKKFKQVAWKNVEKEYNCKISVEPYPNTAPWGPQRRKYIIDNATNGTSECDFAVVSGAWLPEFGGANAAIDTSEFFEKYGMNQVEPALYEVGTVGGKYRCVSAGLNPSRTYVIKGLFYNYGLIKKLGLESPAKLFNEGKWTYEGFLEYCLAAQAVLPENSYAVSGGPSIIWAGMVNAAGIKLADKTVLDLNITHKYSLEALDTLKEINEKKCWSIDEIGYDQDNKPFVEGRAIFSPGEYWFLKAANRYPKDVWGDDTEFGYVPFPYPASVTKEDTKVNFSGESVLMMVEGRTYPVGITSEGVYRAVQDMYLRTMDDMKNDVNFDSDSYKRDALKAKVDDPESIEATVFYTGARTLFDPMFDESFQTEYSGDMTTAVISVVKGSDAKEALDAIYNKVKDAFVRVYGA